MCKCTPNIRTPFCGKPGCGMPERSYRPTPDKLIIGPVKATCEMIYDSQGNHICDIRGWGRLQYFKDGDKLQDKITQFVVDAINEKLDKAPL